jgi:TonB family protein
MIALVLAATLGAGSPALASGPQAPATTLNTTVCVLVGTPDAPQAGKPEPVLPIGTVVAASSGSFPSAERYMRLRRELTQAYRLAELEQTQYDDLTLAPAKAVKIASPAPSVEATATLLSFDDVTAVYRVTLAESGQEAANPVVSVKRGEWAIVGGRDGKEAPYFFVMLRPQTVKELAEEARWQGMTKPKLVDKVMPTYPEEARKAGLDGVVLLDCHIAADGTVGEIRTVEGREPLLVEAARAAVSKWRYEPARNASGQKVEVWLTVTVAFWLH